MAAKCEVEPFAVLRATSYYCDIRHRLTVFIAHYARTIPKHIAAPMASFFDGSWYPNCDADITNSYITEPSNMFSHNLPAT